MPSQKYYAFSYWAVTSSRCTCKLLLNLEKGYTEFKLDARGTTWHCTSERWLVTSSESIRVSSCHQAVMAKERYLRIDKLCWIVIRCNDRTAASLTIFLPVNNHNTAPDVTLDFRRIFGAAETLCLYPRFRKPLRHLGEQFEVSSFASNFPHARCFLKAQRSAAQLGPNGVVVH